MAVVIRHFVCVLLLSSGVIQAGENVALAPDPLALEANWWVYFEPPEPLSGAELAARIETNRTSLKQLLSGLNPGQRENLFPLVKQINEGLERLADLRETAAVNIPAPPPQAEHYGLAAAMDRFMLWRQLKREFDLEQADLAWQKSQLAAGRKRQAKRRSDYLNLPVSDPQRLSQGAGLMASRVNLALASQLNKHQDAKIKIVGDHLQRLENELKTTKLRLVASPGAYADWNNQLAEVRGKADALRERAIAQSYSSLVDKTLNGMVLKHRSLLNANIEIQVGVHELAAKRYQLMTAIEAWLTVMADRETERQADISLLSETVQQFQEVAEATRQQDQFWRSVSSQTRKYLTTRMSDERADSEQQSPVYQGMITLLESSDRTLRELDIERDKGNFVAQLAQEILKDDAGWLDRGLLFLDTGLAEGWDQLVHWMNASLIEINDVPLTPLGLLRVFFIIFIAWLVSRLLRRGLDTLAAHNDALSPSALYTLGRIVHYLVLVLGVVIGLSSIGLDFTKFALFASALGVGIGFGLQNLIGNFVSGLIILFEKSLKVGDFVELSSGLAGEVKEINMRGTLITTNDNIDIIVPNSDFVNNQVTNWTLRETQRRIHIPFGVAYGTDKDIVKKAALEAAEKVKWTLSDDINRQPQVWFVQFGDSSLNFELVVWLKPEAVKRPSAVQAAYLWEIDTMLKAYGIEIPFPQRDLHLRSVFGQKDEAGLLLLNRQNEVDPAHQ